MLKLLIGTASVLVIVFIVPIAVYGALSKPLRMATPEGVSPGRFLLSTLVSKIGTAILLAGLFFIARGVFADRPVLYAALWIVMFIFGEIGQALGPNYSWAYAVAGMISELVYVPASVLVLGALIRQ